MTELELSTKPICCGIEMKHEKNVQNLIDINADTQSWLCLGCGRYITLTDSQLDDDELNERRMDAVENPMAPSIVKINK
jgi:hypothetical protein